QSFLNIISAHKAAYKGLNLLRRFIVLKQLIPLFEFVSGQMQYDLYHVYTVDAHTLLVIRNICRFAEEKYKTKFPLSSEILPTITNFKLLVLAAFFHDIGKGQGGNHSEIGQKVARNFCEKVHLNDDETQ